MLGALTLLDLILFEGCLRHTLRSFESKKASFIYLFTLAMKKDRRQDVFCYRNCIIICLRRLFFEETFFNNFVLLSKFRLCYIYLLYILYFSRIFCICRSSFLFFRKIKSFFGGVLYFLSCSLFVFIFSFFVVFILFFCSALGPKIKHVE